MSRSADVAIAFSTLLLSTRRAVAAPPPAEKPGPVGKGVTLLPNGWRIAPAGSHLDVGDLPLAMAIHPDGKHVVITNNGWSKPSRASSTSNGDAGDPEARARPRLARLLAPDGKCPLSGAADNSIREVEGAATAWPPAAHHGPRRRKDEGRDQPGFMGGLPSPLTARHSTPPRSTARRSFPRSRKGSVVARQELPAEAYTAVLAPDQGALYVSVWGGAKIAVLHQDARAIDDPRRDTRRDAVLERRPAPLRGVRQHERGLGGRPGDARRGREDAAPSPWPRPADAERARARPTARRCWRTPNNNTVAVVDVTSGESASWASSPPAVPDRRRLRR